MAADFLGYDPRSTQEDVLATSKMDLRRLAGATGNKGARLLMVEGRDLGTVWELEELPVSIGREPTNTVILNEGQVPVSSR